MERKLHRFPPFEKREGWGSLGLRETRTYVLGAPRLAFETWGFFLLRQQKAPLLAHKTREKWGTH